MLRRSCSFSYLRFPMAPLSSKEGAESKQKCTRGSPAKSPYRNRRGKQWSSHVKRSVHAGSVAIPDFSPLSGGIPPQYPLRDSYSTTSGFMHKKSVDASNSSRRITIVAGCAHTPTLCNVSCSRTHSRKCFLRSASRMSPS